MSVKRLAVRLVAEGGQQLRAELQGVGDTGARGMRNIESRTQAANRRLAQFARRARMAFAAIAVAATAAAGAMIRSGLQTIDAQSKLARSLDTTTASVQVLERAAALGGVSMGELEGGLTRLTRRLSIFSATGGGPAAAAIERLNLNARELMEMPLDQRLMEINRAIGEYATEAERAGLLSQLFGDRAWAAFARLDIATLQQATRDMEAFGALVTDEQARQIERTNDAVSRLGLVWRGVSNQLAVAAAPVLVSIADALVEIARVSGPVGRAIQMVFENLGRLMAIAGTFVAFILGRWVVAMTRAAAVTLLLVMRLRLLAAAMTRTGIGALIVLAGELVYQFGRLVSATGSWSEALSILRDIAVAVFKGIIAEAKTIPLRLSAVWSDMQAGFMRALANMAESFSDFVSGFEIFANLPMIGPTAPLAVLGQAARGAAFGVDALNRSADQWTGRAAAARTAAAALSAQGWEPLSEALARLREILNEESEGTTRYPDLAAALREVEDALESAPAAARAAGQAHEEGAEVAAEGWARVAESLGEYASEALDLAGQIGDAIVNAFRGAENALAGFVRTGKFDFKSLATSIIADLARIAARRFILGPIANALGGALGGLGGGIFSNPQAPALLSFDRGGHTGYGARSGGLDGMGGRLALVHPRERIIDETRQRGREGGTVNVHFHGVRDVQSFKQSRAQIAADLSRAVRAGQRGS